MLVCVHVLALILTVQTLYAYRLKFESPNFIYDINRQDQTALIDINSAESYVLTNYLAEKQGYNSTNSSKYKDLHQKFQASEDSIINYSAGSVSGVLGEDDHELGTSKNKFAVIDSMNGELTKTYPSDVRRSARLGINPWLPAETDFGKRVRRNVFGVFSKCYKETLDITVYSFCRTNWIFSCLTYDKTDLSNNITLPLKTHPKSYWQTEAERYSYDKTVFNRKFNVIFSTTILDITVPKSLFDQVNKVFNARKTNEGYAFNCAKRSLAKDITLKINGQNVVIPGSIYADEVEGKCYLRLKPGDSNDWVLGLQFYYAYAACFNANAKAVILNKSLYGELID